MQGRLLSRALRFLAALALLPMLGAACLAIHALMPSMFVRDFPFISPEVLAALAGYVAWTLLFLCAPIPPGVYVFGHELTHAAWGLCTGSKVGRIRISADGGSCQVSDPGMFTTLAPYFVPFYLVALLLLRLLLGIWVDMAPHALWWLGGIGFTYGFHLTYTAKTLLETEQPDVREYGRVFSYVLILFFNLLALGVGLVCVTGASFAEYGAALAGGAATSYGAAWRLLAAAWRWRERRG